MFPTPEGITGLEVKPSSYKRKHPILFVHGWWGGAWVWELYMQFFADYGYHCYALNLRGNHNSGPPAELGRISFYEHLSDIQGVVARLGEPFVIGHSMGGLLVQKLLESVSLPGAVALVPVAPRGIFSLTTLRVFLPHIFTMLAQQPLLLSKSDMCAVDLNRLPSHEQEAVYRKMVPAPGRQGIETGIVGIAVAKQRVNTPLLIVTGSDDRLISSHIARTNANRLGADIQEYADHAHYLMREPGWERIAADIAMWLDKRDVNNT